MKIQYFVSPTGNQIKRIVTEKQQLNTLKNGDPNWPE